MDEKNLQRVLDAGTGTGIWAIDMGSSLTLLLQTKIRFGELTRTYCTGDMCPGAEVWLLGIMGSLSIY